MTAYWSWLGEKLKLTVGGRIVFTVMLLIGVGAGAVGTGFAFYNVESGHDPDQALGLQIAFSWFVVAALETLILGVVAAIDAACRGLAARFANPPF